jgi:hypothetical protein
MYFKKLISTILYPGCFVRNSGSFITYCTSDTADQIVGVSRESWAAADTTTELTAVEVPLEQWVEWEIDVDSDGGLADTDVFGYRDLDTKAGAAYCGMYLDASASTDDVLMVTKRISATKGVVVLTRSAVSSHYPVS